MSAFDDNLAPDLIDYAGPNLTYSDLKQNVDNDEKKKRILTLLTFYRKRLLREGRVSPAEHDII